VRLGISNYVSKCDEVYRPRTYCAFPQPHQQDKTQGQPSGFHEQILREDTAGSHVMTVLQVIGEAVIITSPHGYRRRMLQVVHVSVCRLPLLQSHILAHQAELKRWDDELEALQFNLLPKLVSQVKVQS